MAVLMSSVSPSTTSTTSVAHAADEDADLAGFAASIENAFVAVYGIGAAKLSGTERSLANTFVSHHRDHAKAFNAIAGPKAVGDRPNAELFAALGPQFISAPDRKAVLELAFALENSAAATYQYALENLVSMPALRLAASIMPVESQHAVVMGTLLGKDATKDIVPVNFQTKDGFFDPAKFPMGG